MFNRFLFGVKKYFKSDPLLVLLLVLSASYFILYYMTDPTRPAAVLGNFSSFGDVAQYPQGWWGYNDQKSYLELAKTLATFNFQQLHQTYTYGLGYPIVAIPLLWVGYTADPFILFNLFVFVFATFAIYQSAKKLISPFAGVIASFGLIFATPLIKYTDMPWNSTISLLALSSLLLIASSKKNKSKTCTYGWVFCWLGFCCKVY